MQEKEKDMEKKSDLTLYESEISDSDDAKEIYSEEYEEKSRETYDADEEEKCEDFYPVPKSGKINMIWSYVALFFSLLSVVLCPFYYVSLPFALVSLICVFFSRKIIGYFEKMTLTALIISIFGLVFGVFSAVFEATGVIDILIKK